jgi:two-component sensor histidine kinase
MRDYFRFLRSIPFFHSLSDSDIKKIEGVCEEKYFKVGDIVFIEDSLGENFFIILEGSVEIWKDYKEKNVDPLAIFSRGQLFGELALTDNFPRSATVVAREPCRLLSIHRDDFTRIVTESGSISFSIMKSLSFMLRESTSNFLKDLKARNRFLERAYKQLKKTDEQRVASLRQKELLLHAFHHRVRDNIQIINDIISFHSDILTQGNSHSDMCDPRWILDKIKERIQIMTRIHDILFQASDLLKVNAKNYIEKLIHELFQYVDDARDQLRCIVEAEEIFLVIDDAVHLGMIIHELLSNVFRHAFPDNREGEIHIIIQKSVIHNNLIECLFHDNGVGLPDHMDPAKTDTLGFILIKKLAEDYLKANLRITQENGTCCTIRFTPKTTE